MRNNFIHMFFPCREGMQPMHALQFSSRFYFMLFFFVFFFPFLCSSILSSMESMHVYESPRNGTKIKIGNVAMKEKTT